MIRYNTFAWSAVEQLKLAWKGHTTTGESSMITDDIRWDYGQEEKEENPRRDEDEYPNSFSQPTLPQLLHTCNFILYSEVYIRPSRR